MVKINILACIYDFSKREFEELATEFSVPETENIQCVVCLSRIDKTSFLMWEVAKDGRLYVHPQCAVQLAIHLLAEVKNLQDEDGLML